MAQRISVSDRFWTKVDKGGPGGCWVWTASTDSNGYGHISVVGVLVTAHRLSYQWARGPIPEGMELDHLCRNRRCVNPGHLETVTKRENQMRGANSLDFHGACRSGRHKVTSPDHLYFYSDGRRTCLRCRREHEIAYRDRKNARRRARYAAAKKGDASG